LGNLFAASYNDWGFLDQRRRCNHRDEQDHCTRPAVFNIALTRMTSSSGMKGLVK
jgi:hypothetical protein